MLPAENQLSILAGGSKGALVRLVLETKSVPLVGSSSMVNEDCNLSQEGVTQGNQECVLKSVLALSKKSNAKARTGAHGKVQAHADSCSSAGRQSVEQTISNIDAVRVTNLPSAMGYGDMVGLTVPAGTHNIAVGAYQHGIAVWDHISGVLLSCVRSDILTQQPSQELTGLCCAGGGGRIVACMDASRARGGTRTRGFSQSSQHSTSQSPHDMQDSLRGFLSQSSSASQSPGRSKIAKGPSLAAVLHISTEGDICAERTFVPYELDAKGGGYVPALQKGTCVGCDGKHVAVGCAAGGVYMWDVRDCR